MGETSSKLQHKIESAGDLKSVVRTMKAMAGANITQYEHAVKALEDYYQTVQLGLLAYLRNAGQTTARAADKPSTQHTKKSSCGVIIIGSDQGLVGQFNDVLLHFMKEKISTFSSQPQIWAAGERVQAHIEDSQYTLQKSFTLPNSINTVTVLVTDLLQEILYHQQTHHLEDVYLFYNRTLENAQYEPCFQRILPLDAHWQASILKKSWPTHCRPQLLVNEQVTFSALIGEYLFTSLYRACAESLASENASRLIAMQRAEKNIDELQTMLLRQFHRQRQSAIDEELQDLVGGFEALVTTTHKQ